MKQITGLTGLLAMQEVLGFAPSRIAFRNRRESKSDLQMANEKIGIFFGTSTGGTETVASVIASEFGNDVAAGPFEIDTLKGNLQEKFNEYDCLLVGTPTWNTGADTERSGTGWDEMYYSEMQNLKIEGKKVAVFGLGDSESYCDNYADASGELHDVFESLGCNMHGYTSQDGYEHEESKAIRGDKFCGLLLDVVNQNDLTEGRVKSWVSQLKQEGFLGSRKSSQPSTGAAAEDVSTVSVARNVETQSDIAKVFAELEKLEKENAKLRKMLEKESSLQEEKVSIKGEDENGFVPHFNPKSGRTMWISPDGRTCYFTTASSEYKP